MSLKLSTVFRKNIQLGLSEERNTFIDSVNLVSRISEDIHWFHAQDIVKGQEAST